MARPSWTWVRLSAIFCAEQGVFRGREAATEADFEPSAAQDVERGAALGDADRVVVGHDDDGMAEAEAAGALAGGGEDQLGAAGVGVFAHEMMFDEPGAVKAEVIGEGEFVERFGEHLGFAAAEMRGDGEFVKQIDFHAAS
jgi:hypothetical protein